MPISYQEAVRKRDLKVFAALSPVAPVWMVNDEFRPREEALLFNLVYVNPVYGWINERYKYDTFNDVLYHMGERRLREEEALPVQELEPYIPGEVATRVPDSPAYRLDPPLAPAAKP